MSTTDTPDFPMPWEHRVCSVCFKENPYAIWLIKQQCFSPPHHRQSGQVTVAIDPECMKLVEVRPLPPKTQWIDRDFVLCRECRQYKCQCLCAHSMVEVDTWNVKKRIITNTSTEGMLIISTAHGSAFMMANCNNLSHIILYMYKSLTCQS